MYMLVNNIPYLFTLIIDHSQDVIDKMVIFHHSDIWSLLWCNQYARVESYTLSISIQFRQKTADLSFKVNIIIIVFLGISWQADWRNQGRVWEYIISEVPSNISMHCNIMICTHNNVMTHYVTMDIPSNVITYCDVIMAYGTKSSVQYVILTNSTAQNRISTGDLGMEIPFKTGHSMA